MQSWHKSSVVNKNFESSSYYDDVVEEDVKKRWNKDYSCSSTNNSTLSLHIAAYENSEALEEKKNLKKQGEPGWLIKTCNIGSTTIIQNPFEFPRQQSEDKSNHPEIMQFKASQKLLNPNLSLTTIDNTHNIQKNVTETAVTKEISDIQQEGDNQHFPQRTTNMHLNPFQELSNFNSETTHEPPSKKLKEHETMENEATCSIIPILNRQAYTSQHVLRKSFDQFHLLIGVAGSVATIKIAELVEEFHKKNPENLVIKVIATKSSLHFFDPTQLPVDVYVDEDEWGMWKNRGDPVLHIELRKWADAILIAPMDANTLAKVANGLSDNLLTSVLRAWDFSKYAFFAPAMNTCMWEHPLTGQHLKTLKELLLFKEIPPMEKELMCGDKGYGAMAALPMIVSIVNAEIRNKFAVYTR